MKDEIKKRSRGYVAWEEPAHQLYSDLPMLNDNKELCSEYGIVIRRTIPSDKPPKPMEIYGPVDVYNLLSKSKYFDREVLYCLHLSPRNRLLSLEEVFKGSLNSSLVHPREVYKAAILRSAASIILAHNHPSGDPEPTKEDLNLTSRLKDAGDIIGIKTLDHVIIGDDGFYSMRQNQKM